MKPQPSISSKQRGFTLLEALVALVIFAIIVLGSGLVLNQMLKSQKDSLINSIVIDRMQGLLQGAIGSPDPADICTSIKNSAAALPAIPGQSSFYGCATQQIKVDAGLSTETTVTWPILAVSTLSQASADSCAAGTSTAADCYIVGK